MWVRSFLFHLCFEVRLREDINLKCVCDDLLKTLGATRPLCTRTAEVDWCKPKQSPSSVKGALLLWDSVENQTLFPSPCLFGTPQPRTGPWVSFRNCSLCLLVFRCVHWLAIALRKGKIQQSLVVGVNYFSCIC